MAFQITAREPAAHAPTGLQLDHPPATQLYCVSNPRTQQFVLDSLGILARPGVAVSGSSHAGDWFIIVEALTDAARCATSTMVNALDPTALLMPSTAARTMPSTSTQLLRTRSGMMR